MYGLPWLIGFTEEIEGILGVAFYTIMGEVVQVSPFHLIHVVVVDVDNPENITILIRHDEVNFLVMDILQFLVSNPDSESISL